MTEYFYRYRPIKSLLDGFHELENQEIYFSTTGELNDPMEGFKDIYWQGDEIVWKNLLRHYVLCLVQAISYCMVAGESFDPNVIGNLVFWVPPRLPEAPIKDTYGRICKRFFGESVIRKFLLHMANRTAPVRRRELTAYLRAFHGLAMEIIISEFRRQGLMPKQVAKTFSLRRDQWRKSLVSMMDEVTKISPAGRSPEKMFEAIFAASEATSAQLALISEYNLPDSEMRKPLVFWTYRFPSSYVAALDKLVHRDWYVACFTRSAENHSMWSTYADGHRGACLMFKASVSTSGNPSLDLERVTGMSGATGKAPTYTSSRISHEFQSVSYSAKYPSIDFFKSLGAISAVDINDFWYRGDDGGFSECRNTVYADQDGWRNKYWNTFGESSLYKTPEWSHEEEYRIVIHSGFDLTDKVTRKIKYQFCDLAGIVFGERTTVDDKIKIMKIIDGKCQIEKRKDFKFFEIRYVHTQSKFQLFSLDLLKIQPS